MQRWQTLCKIHTMVAVFEQMKLHRYARALACSNVKHAVLRRNDVIIVRSEDKGGRAGRGYMIFGRQQGHQRRIRHRTKEMLPRTGMPEVRLHADDGIRQDDKVGPIACMLNRIGACRYAVVEEGGKDAGGVAAG